MKWQPINAFAAIEAQLRRFRAEDVDRHGVPEDLDASDKTLASIEHIRIAANMRASECDRILGSHQPIPNADLSDLKSWGRTLRKKLLHSEFNSIKIGLAI